MEIKRQTAYLCTTSHIHQGTYVKREGWDPNFIDSSIGALSRIRLVGIVIQREPDQLLLDDRFGTIWLRFFDKLPDLEIGDPVLVIGRPREFAGQKYITVEIARKLPSAGWLKYFSTIRSDLEQYVPEVKQAEAPKEDTNKAETILGIIRELDSKDGAGIDDVLKKASFDDAETVLNILIAEGEVFEVRAGKIKVLE